MIWTIYGRAFKVLMKKPFALWGVSLLSVILTGVFTALCGVVPALAIAITLLMTTSMTMVYLHGYRGEGVKAVNIFDCFKDWGTIKRVLCGMSWMALWIFLWSLIPVVGPIFAIIRTYQYRLTPYILVQEPTVPPTEAIKLSAQLTKGYKGSMFLADFLYGILFGAALLILGLFAMIPFVGILFKIAIAVVSIAYALFSNLYLGLVQAAYYEEIVNAEVCPDCGARVGSGASFCSRCGKQL